MDFSTLTLKERQQLVQNPIKYFLEKIDLIEFRIGEVFADCDWDKTFPSYQDMQKALFDIRELIK